MLAKLKNKILPHRKQSQDEPQWSDRHRSPARRCHDRKRWSTLGFDVTVDLGNGVHSTSPARTPAQSAEDLGRHENNKRRSWWLPKSKHRRGGVYGYGMQDTDEVSEVKDTDDMPVMENTEEMPEGTDLAPREPELDDGEPVPTKPQPADEDGTQGEQPMPARTTGATQVPEDAGDSPPSERQPDNAFQDLLAMARESKTRIDEVLRRYEQPPPTSTTGEILFPQDAGERPTTGGAAVRVAQRLNAVARELNAQLDDHMLAVHSMQPIAPRTKECIVCTETKNIEDFPDRVITVGCPHRPNTCLECLATHIRVQFQSKIFNERAITCPECNHPLARLDVQEWTDAATFAVYAARATRDELDKLPGFFRCPAAECGSGQFHESGEDSPIVTCAGCNRWFCFQHRVVWHETLSCAEYERYLADPEHFKGQLELENERVEQEQAEAGRLRQEQEDADRAFAQSLLGSNEREEAQQLAELERQQRAARERAEREQRAVEEKKAMAKRCGMP